VGREGSITLAEVGDELAAIDDAIADEAYLVGREVVCIGDGEATM
jgi:hypothetical protein